jgi:hypothetical protein
MTRRDARYASQADRVNFSVSVSFGSTSLVMAVAEGAWSGLGGGSEGGGRFAAWTARARCNVNAPCPVPASRISRGWSFSFDVVGAPTCISSNDTMRLA